MPEDQLDQRRSERERQDWEGQAQRLQQQTADILRNAGSINQLLGPVLAMQAVCFRAMADGVEQMARSFGSINQQQDTRGRHDTQGREHDQSQYSSGITGQRAR